jgi:hypothetical protein
LTYCFLRLANLDNGVFELLGRYEAALWRQIVQTLFALQTVRHRQIAAQPSWILGGINPAKACLWRKRTRMLRPMPEWPSDRLHRFIDFPEKSFIP